MRVIRLVTSAVLLLANAACLGTYTDPNLSSLIGDAGTSVTCKNPQNDSRLAVGQTFSFYSRPSGSVEECAAALKTSSCGTDAELKPAVPGHFFLVCWTNGSPPPPAVVTPPVASPGPLPSSSPNPSPSPSQSSTPPQSPATACTGNSICDGFETATAGGAPNSALWSVVTPDCSGSGSVAIDTTQAHSGKQSLRVQGGPNYCDHVFARHTNLPALGSHFFARFFVRLGQAFQENHVTILTMRDATDGKNMRMGGQKSILMYNRELSDATVPSLSPVGISLSTSLAANQWTCVEFEMDQTAANLKTWVNGTLLSGLAIHSSSPVDEVDKPWLSNPWHPSLQDFSLGWEAYGSTGNTLWFDDVVLASQRIGCGN